jgi:excisionase family DNA binding protein
MSDTSQQWRSPPQIAKPLGIDPGKVRGWIDSGELRAVNVATNRGGRPRWRISLEELDAFLLRRQSQAASPTTRRRRRRKREGVTEYF